GGRVHPGLSGYGPENSTCGGPLAPLAGSMSTAIILSPERYTSSRPPRVHAGSDPWASDTFCRFCRGSGNDWMKTSTPWPDSSESYAIQRPSGDNVGWPRLEPFAKNRAAFGEPCSGIVQSSPPPGTATTKAKS